jgi:hypothetical protein
MYIFRGNCIKGLCGIILLVAMHASAMEPMTRENRLALAAALHARLGENSPVGLVGQQGLRFVFGYFPPYFKSILVSSEDESALSVRLQRVGAENQIRFDESLQLGRSSIHPALKGAAARQAGPAANQVDKQLVYLPVDNIQVTVSRGAEVFGVHTLTAAQIQAIKAIHVTRRAVTAVDPAGNRAYYPIN